VEADHIKVGDSIDSIVKISGRLKSRLHKLS